MRHVNQAKLSKSAEIDLKKSGISVFSVLYWLPMRPFPDKWYRYPFIPCWYSGRASRVQRHEVERACAVPLLGKGVL